MRTKSKGVTLIELIIVMGLTLVIMSAAYSFLNTSNKSTANEDLKVMLQSEGNIIENKILNIATQAKGARNIYSDMEKIDDLKILNVDFDSDGNFNLNSIELLDYDGNINKIKLEDNVLTITTNEDNTQILSENVLEMKALPLNINQLTNSEKGKKTISEISGYRFSFKLGAKKGKVEANYDISVQANFRNFDVQLSKSKQEFNKFETSITNLWNKSQSLISVSNAEKGEILDIDLNSDDRDDGIKITDIRLKQYDGSVTDIRFSEPTLSIGSKEFNNVVDFRIKPLDEAKNLRESSGFKILITIEEDTIKNTYEVIVKFKSN